MKKTYIAPCIMVQDIYSKEYMETNVISDGNGNYHEDIYSDDQGTDKEAQVSKSVWDDCSEWEDM